MFAGADGDGEGAAHRTDGAIEGELADKDVLIESLHGAHGAQDGHGYGEVEARPFLAYIGRGEVDGDALIGIAEAGVDESAFDALATFADGHVGHADHHRVPRVAGCKHVDFDIDQVSINAIDRGTAGFEQCHE